jgi:two-component system, chemotaxis family, CheB/CheR fusion protein
VVQAIIKSISFLSYVFKMEKLFKNAISEEYCFAGFLVDEYYNLKEATGNYEAFLDVFGKINAGDNLFDLSPKPLCKYLAKGLGKAFNENEKAIFKHIKVKKNNNTRLINIAIKPVINQDGDIKTAFILLNELLSENDAIYQFSSNTLPKNQKNINSLLSGILNSSNNAILSFKSLKDSKGEIVDFEGVLANNKSINFINIPNGKFAGKRLVKDKILNLPFFDDFKEVALTGNNFSNSYKYSNQKKCAEIQVVKLENDGIVVFINDISEVKFLLEEREKNIKELLEVKENLAQFNSKLEERIENRNKELTLSEDRFKLLSKATNDAVWDWDMSNNTIWWNEGYKNLFGYTTQNVATDKKCFYDLVHPSDYPKIANGLNEIIEHKIDQWHDEFRFLKADGTYAYVLGRAYLIYNNKDAIRMVGSMIDLTEMKQAQFEIMQSAERTRFIAESMPGKVWTTDEKGNVNYMNKRWMEYTGLPFNELKNYGWQRTIHRDDLFETNRLWRISLENGNDFQFEHRILNHDGQYCWHITRAVPSRDGFGKTSSWIASTIDIHDKIVSEERKDEFIGVASHELKTPLTSLKAYTQLLEMTIEAENIADSKIYIKKTNTFINRLNELISDLLDVSKIHSGKLQFNVTNFSFDKLVKESVESIRQVNQHHKISIFGKANINISADKARLEQVFTNYLINAIKYSPKSSKVDVIVLKEKNGIKVAIKDYGIGIPPEKITHVFKRFYRVEGMAHKFQGLGLGLYISAQIIDRHGGKCWVESTEGEGSIFYFSLPEKVFIS